MWKHVKTCKKGSEARKNTWKHINTRKNTSKHVKMQENMLKHYLHSIKRLKQLPLHYCIAKILAWFTSMKKVHFLCNYCCAQRGNKISWKGYFVSAIRIKWTEWLFIPMFCKWTKGTVDTISFGVPQSTLTPLGPDTLLAEQDSYIGWSYMQWGRSSELGLPAMAFLGGGW